MRAYRNLLFYLMPLLLVIVALIIVDFRAIQPQPMRVLQGRSLPMLYLPSLWRPGDYLTRDELLGKVSMVNVWASWCAACMNEHAVLMHIQSHDGIPIYGINYKDNPDSAKKWLAYAGNPYRETGVDINGMIASKLGVYGIPVTFLIDSRGMIRYRHMGVVTQSDWENELLPMVKKYSAELET